MLATDPLHKVAMGISSKSNDIGWENQIMLAWESQLIIAVVEGEQ